ncbi:MAG: BCD family MFS transporter [Pseudomonadota bacterium]|nr:BCD family MFS transporter [Pseudomonadota bacterium]
MKLAVQQSAPLRWLDIFRLGLVQAALGSVVVLISSTLNRVMVVEYALPAVLPGMLVALHYAVQMIRPRFGYGSDRGGRRTPWILGGMAVLAIGGILCAVATVSISSNPIPALALAVIAYAMVGLGVGAAGTSLLVFAAKRVAENRRAAASTIMWILMIAGFAITSTAVGHFLDPFSPRRLIVVTSIAAGIAFGVSVLALWRVEGAPGIVGKQAPTTPALTGTPPFKAALQRVWAEPQARGFTVFVFISMLAYSAQELLLEPFAGLVFGYSLGESARFSGLWHASALLGMIAVGVACSGKRRFGSLRTWTVAGCCASAVALLSLCCADLIGPHWPLRVSVAFLGVSNGAFAVAAIGSMMELAHQGESNSAGVRMGIWGAAQAIAFALGGVLGTSVVDSMRFFFGSPVVAFAVVFGVEALLFLIAASFAGKIDSRSKRRAARQVGAHAV